MKTTLLIAALATACGLSLGAAPLNTSTFTEVIKDVSTLTAAGTAASAKMNDVLNAPDRVRTGPESRAELTSPDQTITRVGANTVFSFEGNSRTMNLEKGNILFHAPKGIGGGTIKSGGAAAAVLGTTLIASATDDGGLKVIFLEGKGTVTLPDGTMVTLKAGQLVYVLPGSHSFSKVLNINLAKLVEGSQLVNGFPDQISSLSLIQQAIQQQETQIASGQVSDTGVSADTYVQLPAAGNGLGGLDQGTYHTGVTPLTSPDRPSNAGGGPNGAP